MILSSVQDFRLKRRGSIQAIAEELARQGRDVTFVSLRFSRLSKRREDPRIALASRANRIEVHEGVKCFLWRTLLHPFNAHRAWVNMLLTPFFYLYGHHPNATLDSILRGAETIVIESGLAIALLARIRRLAPRATLIYRASDRLSAIAQHPVLAVILRKHQSAIDAFCLLGPGMAADFAWAFPKAFVVPPALNRDLIEAEQTCPYDKPINAVSLGAMLFDASFFDVAAPAFPDVVFHIFGVPAPARCPSNVHFYPDIPYAQTWRYIRHATFGIAPYRDHPMAAYLADTSSKLMQYSAVGLPSVCPVFAAGRHAGRFGYQPGDPASIIDAVKLALAAPRQDATPYRSWAEIVPRLLSPRSFADARVGDVPLVAPEALALSLIVATLGRVEPLVRLLTSLQKQAFRSFEVIVVDQNEPGVLDEVLHRFSDDLELRHLRSERGLSRARNVGLAASRGRIVGFPDDDCWYPADRAEQVVRFFDVYGDVDVLLGQTIDEDGIPSVNAVKSAAENVTPYNVWFSGNSNTLFIRGALARALEFDEALGVGAPTRFQSGEESDIVLRALSQGARAIYCPNLTIHHDQVESLSPQAQRRRAWRYAQGFGQVLRRHYEASYLVYRIARSIGGSAIALARGRFKESAYRAIWGLGTARGWLPRPVNRSRSVDRSSAQMLR